MRTFVVGDIHGAFRALRQCFERSGFNKEEDRLIALGDVCDGWPEVRESVDELLSLKHCDYILGNHDIWALAWARDGVQDKLWLSQGGHNTIRSYPGGIPEEHISFLANARPFMEDSKRLFVHAGFDPDRPVFGQSVETLAGDRDFLVKAFTRNQRDPAFRFGG